MQKITLNALKKKKGSEKIVAITAYDAIMARIFDEAVDLILVGDSLNMSFNYAPDTLSISVDEMIYHTKAVCAGAKRAFVVADMPFGSYFDEKSALTNAIRFCKKTPCDAVKLEVDSSKIKIVEKLVKEGIAVMPHIGLTPQSVRGEGGYKVKGRQDDEIQNLKTLARDLQDCGAFGLVLEGVMSDVASDITQSLKIPTIGIGSGANCDGQILVWTDAFGFFDDFTPKFVRKFADGKAFMQNAIEKYANAVKSGDFPNASESY